MGFGGGKFRIKRASFKKNGEKKGNIWKKTEKNGKMSTKMGKKSLFVKWHLRKRSREKFFSVNSNLNLRECVEIPGYRKIVHWLIEGLWLKKGDFGDGFCESEAKKYSYCALAQIIDERVRF